MESGHRLALAFTLAASAVLFIVTLDLLDEDDGWTSRSTSPVWITLANETTSVVLPGGNVPSIVTSTPVRATSETFQVLAGTERLEILASSRAQFYVEVRASASDAWSGSWALTTGKESWFSMVDLGEGGEARVTVEADGDLFEQPFELHISSQLVGVVNCYTTAEKSWCDPPEPAGDNPDAGFGRPRSN